MKVNSCPIRINGSSTGRAPIHVRMKDVLMKIQNKFFLLGEKWFLRKAGEEVKGRDMRMRMEATKAITPPSLFGIERRIA